MKPQTFVFRNKGRGRGDALYMFRVTDDGHVFSKHGSWSSDRDGMKEPLAFTSADQQQVKVFLVTQFKKRLRKGYWPVRSECVDPEGLLTPEVLGAFKWQPESDEEVFTVAPTGAVVPPPTQLAMFAGTAGEVVATIVPTMTMRPYKVELDDERFNRSDYIIEWKYDGHSGWVVVDADGSVRFIKGSGRDITSHFPSFKCPELAGTCLQVEMVAPYDGRSIASDAASFTAAGGYKKIKGGFVILDVTMWKGADVMGVEFQDRAAYRQQADYALTLAPLPFMQPERRQCDAFTQRTIQEWVARGAEGVVLKSLHHTFEPGKSRLWGKWKHRETIDCLVRSYNPGDGRFSEVAGSLVLELINDAGDPVYIGRCSGMSDAVRWDLTDRLRDGEEVIVEVAFDRITKDNGLIMPQFVRERPDRGRKDVTTAKQMPGRTFDD